MQHPQTRQTEYRWQQCFINGVLIARHEHAAKLIVWHLGRHYWFIWIWRLSTRNNALSPWLFVHGKQANMANAVAEALQKQGWYVCINVCLVCSTWIPNWIIEVKICNLNTKVFDITVSLQTQGSIVYQLSPWYPKEGITVTLTDNFCETDRSANWSWHFQLMIQETQIKYILHFPPQPWKRQHFTTTLFA